MGERVRGRGARGARVTPHGEAALAGYDRPALHSRTLKFVHPYSGQMMQFEAPVPSDFEALLDGLRRRNAYDDEEYTRRRGYLKASDDTDMSSARTIRRRPQEEYGQRT